MEVVLLVVLVVAFSAVRISVFEFRVFFVFVVVEFASLAAKKIIKPIIAMTISHFIILFIKSNISNTLPLNVLYHIMKTM